VLDERVRRIVDRRAWLGARRKVREVELDFLA
jgi:hypothetical protein